MPADPASLTGKIVNPRGKRLIDSVAETARTERYARYQPSNAWER